MRRGVFKVCFWSSQELIFNAFLQVVLHSGTSYWVSNCFAIGNTSFLIFYVLSVLRDSGVPSTHLGRVEITLSFRARLCRITEIVQWKYQNYLSTQFWPKYFEAPASCLVRLKKISLHTMWSWTWRRLRLSMAWTNLCPKARSKKSAVNMSGRSMKLCVPPSYTTTTLTKSASYTYLCWVVLICVFRSKFCVPSLYTILIKRAKVNRPLNGHF